eukprot:1150917-Pelagomonas_calceolata.AAC.3
MDVRLKDNRILYQADGAYQICIGFGVLLQCILILEFQHVRLKPTSSQGQSLGQANVLVDAYWAILSNPEDEQSKQGVHQFLNWMLARAGDIDACLDQPAEGHAHAQNAMDQYLCIQVLGEFSLPT